MTTVFENEEVHADKLRQLAEKGFTREVIETMGMMVSLEHNYVRRLVTRADVAAVLNALTSNEIKLPVIIRNTSINSLWVLNAGGGYDYVTESMIGAGVVRNTTHLGFVAFLVKCLDKGILEGSVPNEIVFTEDSDLTLEHMKSLDPQIANHPGMREHRKELMRKHAFSRPIPHPQAWMVGEKEFPFKMKEVNKAFLLDMLRDSNYKLTVVESPLPDDDTLWLLIGVSLSVGLDYAFTDISPVYKKRLKPGVVISLGFDIDWELHSVQHL